MNGDSSVMPFTGTVVAKESVSMCTAFEPPMGFQDPVGIVPGGSPDYRSFELIDPVTPNIWEGTMTLRPRINRIGVRLRRL